MKILLFDMDGVLLRAGGYHRALQETVRIVAAERGLGEVWLTPEDIAAYESAGATSEWDTSAISIALLLAARHLGEPAGFSALAHKLAAPELAALAPLQRVEQVLLNGQGTLPQGVTEEIRNLLSNARSIQNSRTHRLFQELVLGSVEYEKTYRRPPEIHTESYLVLYDRTNLNPRLVKYLKRWLGQPGQYACILTSRPSRPPRSTKTFGTPEAELGLKLVGLAGVPVVGWGALCWLGEKYKVDPQILLKPSPVHALAALGKASGLPKVRQQNPPWSLTERIPLEMAYTTGIQGGDTEFWQPLNGAEVIVFEDTCGGLRSAKAARDVLAQMGVEINLRLVGIAQDEMKRNALRQCGAQVHPQVSEVLEEIL